MGKVRRPGDLVATEHGPGRVIRRRIDESVGIVSYTAWLDEHVTGVDGLPVDEVSWDEDYAG